LPRSCCPEREPLEPRDGDADYLGHGDRLHGFGSPDPVPLLVSLKAVDPGEYPYYGQAELEPAMSLDRALDGDSRGGRGVSHPSECLGGQTLRLGEETSELRRC